MGEWFETLGKREEGEDHTSSVEDSGGAMDGGRANGDAQMVVMEQTTAHRWQRLRLHYGCADDFLSRHAASRKGAWSQVSGKGFPG